jgi:hypothetical protein
MRRTAARRSGSCAAILPDRASHIRRAAPKDRVPQRVGAEADVLHQHGYRAQLHRSQREDAALSREVAIDVRSAIAGLAADEEVMVAYFRA